MRHILLSHHRRRCKNLVFNMHSTQAGWNSVSASHLIHHKPRACVHIHVIRCSGDEAGERSKLLGSVGRNLLLENQFVLPHHRTIILSCPSAACLCWLISTNPAGFYVSLFLCVCEFRSIRPKSSCIRQTGNNFVDAMPRNDAFIIDRASTARIRVAQRDA